MNLQQHQVYTVDLGAGDTPTFITAGATATPEAATGWNCGPAMRLTPPTMGGYGALGGFDIWRNGTFTVRKLNFRFEVQFGPDFARNWPFDDLKFIIVHTADTLGGNTNERPMCNWANADMNGGPGILAWAVGAGTVKNFNPVGQPSSFSPPDAEDFYLGPAAGTFRGKPLIPPSEWLSIEVEIVAESTTANPNGRIRSIIHRRGVATPLTEVSIPWNYDSNWSLPRFISEVQVIGGYFNTGTIASMPGNHFRIANYITFAANRPGLLGPRADFVQ